MRQQIIITLILSVVLSVALAIRMTYFQNVGGYKAYPFLTITWICAVLIAILLFNIVYQLIRGRNPSPHGRSTVLWPNRRKTYRIIYPAYERPKLFVERADNQAKRQLEYPVLDLSQNGLCFLDDGSLGAMHSIEGRILLKDGETIRINGKVLRNQNGHISVQLFRGIDWSTILNEQRRLLSHTKPSI